MIRLNRVDEGVGGRIGAPPAVPPTNCRMEAALMEGIN